MDRSILINKDNKLKKNYMLKSSLIEIEDISNNKIQIDSETYIAYLELRDYLKTINIEIGITSAYRTIEEQNELYNQEIEKYGEELGNKYIAKGEYSEHNTSLAMDITLKKDNKFIIDKLELLKYGEELNKIHQVLYKFGFILRYPKYKEQETKYCYKPWHIRYIGKFISKILYENNLTLEEYKKYYSGIIILNKKRDYTSYDIVKILSHLYGLRKIGHTGTLDPLAEGVLIICIGNATKIEELITAEDKEYIAEVKLGIRTDTYDIEGKVLEQKEISKELDIKNALAKFKKTYLQEVPKYSAVKVNGKKLYEYARGNIEVELPKKEVTIKEIELLEQTKDTFKFRTLVSKGCYIRSLINELSKELNFPMTMTSLLRTKQGLATIDEAYTLEEIKENKHKMYSIEDIINFPIIVVNNEDEFKISNGVPVNNKWNIKDKVLFKNEDNKLLGIYQKEENKLKVWKNFNNQ